MILFPRMIWFGVCAALTGCATTHSTIVSERQQFLADPTIPSFGYDGKPNQGGMHYRFLFEHDSAFGDFLVTVVPTTADPRIVVAALTFFGTKHPDPVKFESVVASIDRRLLDKEVDLSASDVITMVSLRDWLADFKKQALVQKPMMATPATGVAHL